MKKHTLLIILTLGILAAVPEPAQAGRELASKTVATTMSKRAAKICDGVLPAWIKSSSGIRDKSVRRLVADCYLAQARLPLIGAKAQTLDTAIILNEVPLTLLQRATGLRFDAYAPIAGVEIRVRNTNSLRGINNE